MCKARASFTKDSVATFFYNTAHVVKKFKYNHWEHEVPFLCQCIDFIVFLQNVIMPGGDLSWRLLDGEQESNTLPT